MGVVTVPSSATRTTPLGVTPRRRSLSSPPTSAVVAFKPGRPKPAIAAAQKPPTLEPKINNSKKPKRVKAVAVDALPAPSSSSSPSPSPTDSDSLDYNEVAAALENIYKLSPPLDAEERRSSNVVRSRRRGPKRLSLEKRVGVKGKKREVEREDEEVQRLVRDYSVSTDLVSLDWKRMKIPPVLSAAEQGWLFGLMQPMKAIFQVKENLHKDLSREPTDGELASAVNMSVTQLRRDIEVGRAARNKLIKHNLRLVLFVINKYYQEMASGEKFQDLCQAGAKGLITAIDRFEPKRGFRLSTYALFWIRHSIIRSMTLSSFTRVSFGIESVRQEIQKAKLELIFELQRLPTEEEIISRVGISPERYHDVMKAAKAVYSLNARHAVTQEEFINGITDTDGVGGDKRRQPALLRLALDDVLDSLKPKESLVIRQRYGLDGKGDRTLGEIAGNLNISREMVRKHELKALMKLKHPARVDYLRRYV